MSGCTVSTPSINRCCAKWEREVFNIKKRGSQDSRISVNRVPQKWKLNCFWASGASICPKASFHVVSVIFPFFNIFPFGGTLLQELWIRKGGSKGGFRYYSTSFGPFFFRLFLLCCLPQWIIAKSSARIATIMFEFPPWQMFPPSAVVFP